MPRSDCVVLLHSHLPWVLHHGQWPHGSDWLCEAATGTYLPLIDLLQRGERDSVPTPITLGVTPVLAAQLAHSDFRTACDDWLDGRDDTCRRAARDLRGAANAELLSVVEFWARRYSRLRHLWQSIDRDIPGTLAAFANRGRIELISSAATHAFLPLLGRDESITLQLHVGQSAHAAMFGRPSRGCWLPECAWRNAGDWEPFDGAYNRGWREGLAPFLESADYEYICVDAHMAHAGPSTGVYGTRFPGRKSSPGPVPDHTPTRRSPHKLYRVSDRLTAFVRDPAITNQVWDRHQGFPGHGAYLEFHKQNWPGGLRLWRVTDRGGDLGDKLPYDPATAHRAAKAHGVEFVQRLSTTARGHAVQVIAAPFDTELFGHWWFEGPVFLDSVFRHLPAAPGVHARQASTHRDATLTPERITLREGSWGRDGDYGMWMNDEVAWVWPIIWELENRFWDLVPAARTLDHVAPLLDQAARELLLLQSSDWAFIMTTVVAADYGARRFHEHAHACRELVGLLDRAVRGDDIGRGVALAASRFERTDLFPDIHRHLSG